MIEVTKQYGASERQCKRRSGHKH